MYRVSIILKNARQDKDLEISEVSKKLKIPGKYLEAIENEKKAFFPQEPYCSLIVKDYANFLGLNGEELLPIFRRDYSELIKEKQVAAPKVFFTPQHTFKFGILFSVIIFIAYLFLEYVKFNRPPALKIDWPSDSVTANSIIDISGTTDPESTVRINNDLIIVDTDGKFEKKFNVSSPEAKIVIESRSISGKTAIQEKIYYPKWQLPQISL